MILIEFATLLLAGAALVMAMAAFRKATSTTNQDANALRDQALRQEFAELKSAIETLPGRIADETAASPLREAVEGVRESISRSGELLEESVARIGQELLATSATLEASLDRGFRSVGSSLESVRLTTENGFKSAQSKDDGVAWKGLETTLRESIRMTSERSEIQVASMETGFGKLESTLFPVVESIGRLSGRIDALPDALAVQSLRLEEALGGLSKGMSQLVQVGETSLAAQTASGGPDLVVSAITAQAGTVEKVLEAVLEQSFSSAKILGAIESTRQELLLLNQALSNSSLPVTQGLQSLALEWNASIAQLPSKIAEASANQARPMPELEELAIAVRESGHLRGDVARSVGEAVSRISQELSSSAQAANTARDESALSLQVAMDRLEAFAHQIETRLAPLSDALKGHGDAVGPIAHGLSMAQDRLEEAAASLRANQAEFAASVGLFTLAAQELSGGLSLFAREGDRQGAEDPRAAQKALLESLDRMMVGFAESLKSLLTESDLRTREVLAELAARLPTGQGA